MTLPPPPSLTFERTYLGRAGWVWLCLGCGSLLYDSEDARAAHRAWHDVVIALVLLLDRLAADTE